MGKRWLGPGFGESRIGLSATSRREQGLRQRRQGWGMSVESDKLQTEGRPKQKDGGFGEPEEEMNGVLQRIGIEAGNEAGQF